MEDWSNSGGFLEDGTPDCEELSRNGSVEESLLGSSIQLLGLSRPEANHGWFEWLHGPKQPRNPTVSLVFKDVQVFPRKLKNAVTKPFKEGVVSGSNMLKQNPTANPALP
jgi:hypothetical protein